MERYIYTFQGYPGSGYTQTFRSELHCNQTYTGNASLVPSSTYERVFNHTNYAKSAYVDSPRDVASAILALIGNHDQKGPASTYNISQAACYYIQGRQPDYQKCGLDYYSLTNPITVSITPTMKEYFDRSEALMTVLNTKTLFACERCRTQDITFSNFTAYLAGLSAYIGGFTTAFLVLIGWNYTTDITELLRG
ncbi:hypothetical protein BGZ95_008276, partial [Linnemannia exigua]